MLLLSLEKTGDLCYLWGNNDEIMERGIIVSLFLLLSAVGVLRAAPEGFSVRGRVIDKLSRRPVPYAAVVLQGPKEQGAVTDSSGLFLLSEVPPGIYRLSVSCMGYKETETPEYIVSAATPFVEVELEEDPIQLQEVVVRPSPFRRTAESPVSMHVIGLGEIEKSPGANRDVSRLVRSYPGVAFSPVGYRNDLIVRGGGPSENRFFVDGIEIPNINHFATQGASGGPVGIINADLVREIGFYTGAFPADRGGALGSVLDFKLRDGDPEKNTFKATLGASEAAFSGNGHAGEKTTWLFSARQSYLQLLFKALGLPFLPNYIDGQFKVRTRFSESHELVLLGIAGFDNMRLNMDAKDEGAEYLLGYLPRIRQETFTVGAAYRHYAGRHTQSVTLGHSYLNNRNLKYVDNDASSEENLMLRLRSVEQKTTLRAENRSYLGNWTLRGGAEVSRMQYLNRTRQRLYEGGFSASRTDLALAGWGVFLSADYASPNRRFTASAGFRADGCSYSPEMERFWEQFSPRLSLSYALGERWSLRGSAGVYYQLPPYTGLGFTDAEGELANRGLEYMRVGQAAAGFEWRPKERLAVTWEAFYKRYGNMPLSVADGIPLACKGNDYGVVGNELLVSSAAGRAYGFEAMLRWQRPGRFYAVGSFTLYRSEYRSAPGRPYIVSAWDNRFILNASGTYELPRRWSVGARLSCIGGAPYTPYDTERSSLVEEWDRTGRPYYDYDRYNAGRLKPFAQLDVRVDKSFYFRNCMLGLYLDLQNVTVSRLRQPDVPVSTGKVENPDAPRDEQRYAMKFVEQVSGTLLPTFGVTVEF